MNVMRMQPEQFEQLLSAWLDEPQREDLRQQIEAAVAATPEFGQLRDEWVHLHHLILGQATVSPALDWSRLQQRTSDRVAQEPLAASDLDAALRTATNIEARVDWQQLRGRIGQTIAGDASHGTTRRRSTAVRWAASLLAAAAAVLLLVVLPSSPPQEPQGIAAVAVTPAAPGVQAASSQTAVAIVSVTRLADDEAEATPQTTEDQADQPQLAEVFFTIDPVQHVDTNVGGMTPLRLN